MSARGKFDAWLRRHDMSHPTNVRAALAAEAALAAAESIASLCGAINGELMCTLRPDHVGHHLDAEAGLIWAAQVRDITEDDVAALAGAMGGADEAFASLPLGIRDERQQPALRDDEPGRAALRVQARLLDAVDATYIDAAIVAELGGDR
ncbi:MAG: hypothetical protein FWF90_11540 [Promicromonosporaceae bacterium]|nr:hypothetical protein [Promicromonosporaceae bacterium]